MYIHIPIIIYMDISISVCIKIHTDVSKSVWSFCPMLVCNLFLHQWEIKFLPSTVHSLNRPVPLYMCPGFRTVNLWNYRKYHYQLKCIAWVQFPLFLVFHTPLIFKVAYIHTFCPHPLQWNYFIHFTSIRLFCYSEYLVLRSPKLLCDS